MMASVGKQALYTGVTSDIIKRIWQHKNCYNPNSFTAKYLCSILVYYKYYEDIGNALIEEKRIKGGSRAAKERLIESMNYDWRDLSSDFY
jgi:putative endonuclease